MTANIDFVVRTGERFWWDFTAQNPDLTLLNWDGYSAELQLRVALTDASPVFDASTSNSMITAAGTTLEVNISGVDTATIPPGDYFYDFKVWSQSDESDAEFITAGKFKVLEAATR